MNESNAGRRFVVGRRFDVSSSTKMKKHDFKCQNIRINCFHRVQTLKHGFQTCPPKLKTPPPPPAVGVITLRAPRRVSAPRDT